VCFRPASNSRVAIRQQIGDAISLLLQLDRRGRTMRFGLLRVRRYVVDGDRYETEELMERANGSRHVTPENSSSRIASEYYDHEPAGRDDDQEADGNGR
jgi:hypothetical protein